MSHVIEIDQKEQEKQKYSVNLIQTLIKKINYGNSGECQIKFNKISHFQFQFKRTIFLKGNYEIILKASLTNKFYFIQSQLICKSSPVIISSRKIRLILERTLQKYQSKHTQKIYISNNGSINTNKYIHLSQQFIFNLVSRPTLAQTYVHNEIQKFIQRSATFFKSVIIKINFDKQQISKIKPSFLLNFQRTKKICNSCLYPPLNKTIHQTYVYKFPTYQQQYFPAIHKNISLYYLFDQEDTKTHENLNYILQVIKNQGTKKNNLSNNEIDNQIQKILKIYHKNIKYVRNSQDFQQTKQCVFNQINILNVLSLHWQQFQTTSFSNLLKGKIKYQNFSLQRNQKGLNQNIFQKSVILKYQCQQIRKTPLIRWEKQIIKLFKCKHCVFIPKYYHTQQNLLQSIENRNNSLIGKRNNYLNKSEFLICEYIKRGNLKNWLIENNNESSMCTKINIVIYLLYGLNCIHNFNIVHLDLKPANILIDKNNITKITDFGSSYNQQIYNKMKKQKIQYLLSFSIPYTPPQIFMKKKKPVFSPKCDIYSLGIILFQIYFERNLFDFNMSMLTQLYCQLGKSLQIQNKKMYDVLLKKIFVSPQKFEEQGLAQSLWLILNICLKCLNAQQQMRPSLEWIIIAVKQNYLNFIEFYNQG